MEIEFIQCMPTILGSMTPITLDSLNCPSWKVSMKCTNYLNTDTFRLISPERRMMQFWNHAPSYLFQCQSWSYFTATFCSRDISNVCKFNPLTDVTASRKCWKEAPQQIMMIIIKFIYKALYIKVQSRIEQNHNVNENLKKKNTH